MPLVKGTENSEVLDLQDGVTNGVDLIFGQGGNDTIYAYGGNDTITGGYGADWIAGGFGLDTASYHDSGAAVNVSLASGTGRGGSAEGDRLFDVENLNGSYYYDDILTGDDDANVLLGYGGRDTLKGGGGDDKLKGGEDNDTLKGAGGADTLYGGLGVDNMSGGAGDDVYYVDGGDTATEAAGEGYDVVYSSAYEFRLSNDVEVLSLASVNSRGVYGTGNAQANTIYGNAGDNVLDGGGGSDDLSGLGGNDIFVFRPGQAGGDAVYEFEGNGAGNGDRLQFVGYGTIADGASFVQLNANVWQITSADGLIQETITLIGAPTIEASDLMFL